MKQAAHLAPHAAPEQAGSLASQLSLIDVMHVCRRHPLLLAAWIVGLMALSGLIIVGLQPMYRAQAIVELKTRTEHLTGFKSVITGPIGSYVDPAVPRTEMDVLDSPDLARRVVQQLHLAALPGFLPKPSALSGLVTTVEQHLGLQQDRLPDKARVLQQAVDVYMRRLFIYNDGRSYTYTVSFEASNQDLAARIVNTHVALYLDDQRNLKHEAAQRAASWITAEVHRTGDELGKREKAIRDFRESSGLVSARGSTVTAQQVADVGTKLAEAKVKLATLQAQNAEVKAAARAGDPAAQSRVIDSDLIHKLREQEASARQDLATAQQRVGNGDFLLLAPLKARVASIEQHIAQEVDRINRSIDSDLQVARLGVDGLNTIMQELQAQLVTQDKALAQVDDMERDAATLRAAYTSLLSREHEVDAEVGAEEADSRVIASATAPTQPSFPNTKLFLAVTTMLAAGSGIGLAFLVDRPGLGIVKPEQLDSLTGAVALQPLPLVNRRIRRNHSLPDYLVARPQSEFADAVRSLRGDVILSGGHRAARVLAITSALPGEGKTTVAAALARSMAAAGQRVLLIDADLRRPRVGDLLGIDTGGHIVDVLCGQMELMHAVVIDRSSPLRILRAAKSVAAPQDLLASDAIRDLLRRARDSFDMVLIDLPPVGSISDAMLVAPHVDSTLLVVRWKGTLAITVQAVLQRYAQRNLPLAGAVLNAMDQRFVARHDPDLARLYRSMRTYYTNV